MWHRNAHLERICFLPPPVPREFCSSFFLLRLRMKRHDSIPAAVNSSTFGSNVFWALPARQYFRSVNFNDFFFLSTINSNRVRLRAFACLHQQCALLCKCDRSRACVFSLLAREIARAPNARFRERFRGVSHGKLRLSLLRFPLPTPLVGWMMAGDGAVQTEQPQNN